MKVQDHVALTDARIKVMRAWSSVDQELNQLEASLPFQSMLPRYQSGQPHLGASSSPIQIKRAHGTRRARSPDIELKDRQISINFPVRNRASFTDLLIDLVVQLGGQSRSKAVQDGQLMVEVSIYAAPSAGLEAMQVH